MEISTERREGGVAVLSLNAPDRRNALTAGMAEELVAVLGPAPPPWAAALELERASQMWSMRRRALRRPV
jgi:hypothetical protein